MWGEGSFQKWDHPVKEEGEEQWGYGAALLHSSGCWKGDIGSSDLCLCGRVHSMYRLYYSFWYSVLFTEYAHKSGAAHTVKCFL